MDGARRRIPLGFLSLTGALVVSVLSGCAAIGVSDDNVSATDGPLDLSLASGGNGLYPPGVKGDWHGTFGGFRLCLTEPGTATLTRVEFLGQRDPNDEVRAVVRRVSKAAAEAGATPVFSEVGTPEDEFGSQPGQSIEPLKGAEIADVCKNPPDVTAGFSELMTVLFADADGNSIDAVRLSYTFNDESYLTTTRWENFVCDRARKNEQCSPNET
ncbi:hypothetical protein [Aeromicrobium sp. HA]|uniref:hypothetical protein n=1 Tax=Aeromicrobium sp. HA TaxID=3009077 RepID=UPI0022AF78C1|nr:hypothetical protein [Aeromicrobium sp. HA]